MEERIYDLIFICRPDTPEGELDKLTATLDHVAAEKGAKIEKAERWGVRKLAYRVDRVKQGFFIYYVIRTDHSEVLKEMERRLKVSDMVIKYMTVRLDEELKRQKKLQRHRERRAARRPRKPAPTSGVPSSVPASNVPPAALAAATPSTSSTAPAAPAAEHGHARKQANQGE
jgi:small subunit ribosomal protein S6